MIFASTERVESSVGFCGVVALFVASCSTSVIRGEYACGTVKLDSKLRKTFSLLLQVSDIWP